MNTSVSESDAALSGRDRAYSRLSRVASAMSSATALTAEVGVARAVRAVKAIGAKIAREIATEHVTGQLTATQDATAIAALLGKLKTHGVTAATVQRLTPSALTPGPYNLLTHLR